MTEKFPLKNKSREIMTYAKNQNITMHRLLIIIILQILIMCQKEKI